LDECWFVAAQVDVRVERLVARHVHFGRGRADATARATTGSDADNARIVALTKHRADRLVAG
jgi:hypothetical protein